MTFFRLSSLLSLNTRLAAHSLKQPTAPPLHMHRYMNRLK